ncbi:hypothetical protein FB567DRAFT_341088 [Paraphoma chrysanthemicola]|uniref:CFEM domain-containing protein n=1 Tax=Paraphoma chrysanthemicola TaxID=798071 RepID=A0A8K0R784_9PLEO|nr:hypothetical protein FB567DRAFT_341088 [Paraphoma chrysanthemicola]
MLSRWALLAIVCLLSYVKAEALQFTRETTTLGLNDVPQCGITCIGNALPAFSCSLSDVSCLCTNDGLKHALADCMLANCTMYDTLNTLRVQKSICNLSDEGRKDLFSVMLIVYCLVILCIALRLVGKSLGKGCSTDDYVAVGTLFLMAVPMALILAAVKAGFGDHTWNLEHGALKRILLLFWLAWTLYTAVLGMIKVSIVLFYIEIFHTAPNFKKIAYVVLAFIVVNTVILMLLTVFNCSPVASFYNQDIKGKCRSIQALSYASSACSIVQDLVLLVLPLFWIRRLQMRLYRKIAVGFMFAIGSFGLIATLIRLKSLLTFNKSLDPTWDYAPMALWSEIEVSAGFLCMSLPALRVLVFHLMPAGLKRLLSHVTSEKRTGAGGATDLPASAKDSWRKPSSYVHVSDEVILETGTKGGFIKTMRSSGHKNHFPSRSRSEQQRSESAQSIHGVPEAFKYPLAPSEASRATDDSRSSIELVHVRSMDSERMDRNMDSERMDILVSRSIEHRYEEDITAIPNIVHSAECTSRPR